MKVQSNSKSNEKARNNNNISDRNSNNNVSSRNNNRVTDTNKKSSNNQNVGFETKATESFELDEDNDHSFELKDCK